MSFVYFIEQNRVSWRMLLEQWDGWQPSPGFAYPSDLDKPPEALYWDPQAEELKEKPEKPSDEHYWDDQVQRWLKVLPPFHQTSLFAWSLENRAVPKVLETVTFVMYLELAGASLAYREQLATLEVLKTEVENEHTVRGEPGNSGD